MSATVWRQPETQSVRVGNCLMHLTRLLNTRLTLSEDPANTSLTKGSVCGRRPVQWIQSTHSDRSKVNGKWFCTLWMKTIIYVYSAKMLVPSAKTQLHTCACILAGKWMEYQYAEMEYLWLVLNSKGL